MSASPEPVLKGMKVHARVSAEILERLDACAARMGRPGIPVNRSDAVRHVLLRGLDALEAELKRG
jgi:hypothetical protein